VARQTAEDQVVLRVRVVGTELPGTCHRDPQDPPRPVKDPVFVGIQRGREVVEAVPASAKTVTFTPEFRVAKSPGGAPNFLKWTGVQRAVRTGRPITVRLRLTDAKGGPVVSQERPSEGRADGAASLVAHVRWGLESDRLPGSVEGSQAAGTLSLERSQISQ
jgi:hypothetical protein